ncbi:hypothetical protein Dda_1611 [Drechslerella dactyloides]|uniref:Uncharacterized protein n=1 Tax=Drechslerella dactyloides TaxID=74499 RepID=A0AAD6J6F4_DREDA|nr:hypothetical protein Dda_1611 [Drechslerella dactyloides]
MAIRPLIFFIPFNNFPRPVTNIFFISRILNRYRMCRQQVNYTCGHRELKWERVIPCPSKVQGCPEILSTVEAGEFCISCRAAQSNNAGHMHDFAQGLRETALHEKRRELHKRRFLKSVEKACREARMLDECRLVLKADNRRAKFIRGARLEGCAKPRWSEEPVEELRGEVCWLRRLLEWYHDGMPPRCPSHVIAKGQKIKIGAVFLNEENTYTGC